MLAKRGLRRKCMFTTGSLRRRVPVQNCRETDEMATFLSIVPATLAIAVAGGAAFATCEQVAGSITATIVGGEPLNVLGTVSGDLEGATRAVVMGQEAGEDGRVALDLTHDFVTLDGSSLKTMDKAVWTPVPGHEGVFHMRTTYTITGGTGTYAAASGELVNEGVAETTTGLVTLRYGGQVCVD
jgi:hypothetical protein